MRVKVLRNYFKEWVNKEALLELAVSRTKLLLTRGVGREAQGPGEQLPAEGGEGRQGTSKLLLWLVKPRMSLVWFTGTPAMTTRGVAVLSPPAPALWWPQPCAGTGRVSWQSQPRALPCLPTLEHSRASPTEPGSLSCTSCPSASPWQAAPRWSPPGPPPVTMGPGQPCGSLHSPSCPCPGTTALGGALGASLCQMQFKAIAVPQSSGWAIASPKWAPQCHGGSAPGLGLCSLTQQRCSQPHTGQDLHPERPWVTVIPWNPSEGFHPAPGTAGTAGLAVLPWCPCAPASTAALPSCCWSPCRRL